MLGQVLRVSELIRREGNTLVITLNWPERRNAYGAEVRDGLVAALGLVAADATIASVVLDGAGGGGPPRARCSGSPRSRWG